VLGGIRKFDKADLENELWCRGYKFMLPFLPETGASPPSPFGLRSCIDRTVPEFLR
jgi:hypothetical protein